MGNNNSEMNRASCNLCYDCYDEEDDVVITKCKHLFHRECIKEYHFDHQRCPECQTRFEDQKPFFKTVHLHFASNYDEIDELRKKGGFLIDEIEDKEEENKTLQMRLDKVQDQIMLLRLGYETMKRKMEANKPRRSERIRKNKNLRV